MTRYVAPTETVVVAGAPAAIRFRRCVITVLDGPDKGKEISLGQRTIRIGTAAENDVVLSDRAVSRYHCEIEARDDGFLLRDQASKNGVYIGPVRIREALLEGTTKLRLANDIIKFAPAGDAVEVALSKNDRFGDALGNSVAMREVFTMLERAAPTDLTVLLEGETGTGKE
ncbi:MAG TPA: FHA domain-containing protein, partial [bacterium]|nr:FHA domain-containing protein [bacterium]